MSVFADTFGLYALIFESEEGHADVVRAFRDTLTGDWPLGMALVRLIHAGAGTYRVLRRGADTEPARLSDLMRA